MKKKILGLLFGAVLLAATFTLAACDGLFGPDIIDDGDNGFVAVTSVTISGDTTVEINDEVTYTATVLPETATNSNVTWSVVTGGTATATISSAGVFKATTVGTATIKAVAGGESDTHEITVEDNTPVTPPEPETLSAPANITIDKANYLIKWDAPAGEVKHVELYIDDNSGNRIIEVQELAKTTLNFNLKRAELKKIGRYKIGIRCVHATDSDLDSEYEVTTYDFDTYKSGEGTEASPYVIETPKQFAAIVDFNTATTHFLPSLVFNNYSDASTNFVPSANNTVINEPFNAILSEGSIGNLEYTLFESISSTGRLYNVYISVDSPDNANDVEDFVFDGYITPVNNGLIEYVTVSAGRTAYIAGTEPISGPITSMFVGSNNGTIKYSGVDFDEGLWENINLISTRPQGYDAALTAAVFVQTNTGLIEESYVQGYSNGESVATFDGMNGVGGFVYLNRGVIKNCAFELDLEIVGLQTYGNNGSYVGTFVAENEKFSSYENKIEYCDFDMTYGPDSVTLTVRNSAESLTFANIGGFVGRNDATIAECEITNFSIIVNDSTKPHIIGGFVATAQTINAGEISNSIVDYSTITAIIHEDGYVGGFFGYSAMTSNRFTNCSVKLEKNTEEGMFTVKSSNYGGFAGNNMTLGDTNIVGCTYSSTLAGTNSAIGGFRNVEGVTVAN